MSDQNPFQPSRAPFTLLVSLALTVVLSLVLMLLLDLTFWLTLFAGLMVMIVVFALLTYFGSDEATVRRAEELLGVKLTDPAPAPVHDPAADPAAVPVAEPQEVPQPRAAEEEVAPVAESAPPPAVEADAPAGKPDAPAGKPVGLDAPRAGGADDLKRIKGVGPKLEELLHSMGYYHFDQIAAWSDAEIAWVDANLEGFRGRVTRDEWVPQARALAAGEDGAD